MSRLTAIVKAFSLITIAVFLFSGCAIHYGTTYDIYIDPAYREKSILARKAVYEWESATDVKFHIHEELPYHQYNNEFVLHILNASELYNITNNPVLTGFTTRSGVHDNAIIWIVNNLNYSNTFKVLLHEIGHALGLDHNGSGNIMSSRYADAPQHLTCSDIQQYYWLRGKQHVCQAKKTREALAQSFDRCYYK